MYERLERRVDKSSVEFPDESKNAMVHCALSLYYSSLGQNQLSPQMIQTFQENLKHLMLPHKILVHRELKDIGYLKIEHGEVKKGSDLLSAAHYFWQNFIVFDRTK